MKIARFLYTGFYSGLSPVAPGTMGSIVGFLLYVGLCYLLPVKAVYISAAIAVLLLYPAIKLGDIAEKDLGKKDPQSVVLDEIFGYLFAVFLIPFSLKNALIALVLFRIFDICKPFPVSSCQRFKGGAGIFLDDVVAGVIANVILWVLIFFNIL